MHVEGIRVVLGRTLARRRGIGHLHPVAIGVVAVGLGGGGGSLGAGLLGHLVGQPHVGVHRRQGVVGIVGAVGLDRVGVLGLGGQPVHKGTCVVRKQGGRNRLARS